MTTDSTQQEDTLPTRQQPQDGDVLYGNGLSGPDRRRYPRTLVIVSDDATTES